MPSQKIKSEPTISETVLKNASKNLREQRKDQESDFVNDYLYDDAQRIASFLAQFETYGVLRQVKATESAGHTTTEKTDLSVAGKVPLVAEGRAALDVSTGGDERETVERTYDPLRANAATFLNYLADRSLIEQDLRKARIGQFVLVTGHLSVSDLSLNKIVLKIPPLRKQIEKEIQIHQKKLQAKQKKGNKIGTAPGLTPQIIGTVVTSLVNDLSHSISARLQVGELVVWSMIIKNFMVVSDADIILKHGSNIEGSWNILGIIDALPSKETTPTVPEHVTEETWQKMAEVIASFARRTLGRPMTAYGMTPLLIFRKVSGQGQPRI